MSDCMEFGDCLEAGVHEVVRENTSVQPCLLMHECLRIVLLVEPYGTYLWLPA